MPTIEARTIEGSTHPGPENGLFLVDTRPLFQRVRSALSAVTARTPRGIAGPSEEDILFASSFADQPLRNPNPYFRVAVLVGMGSLAVLGANQFFADSASAQGSLDNNFCPPGQEPSFVLGFAALREAVGEVMGDPLTCEYNDPNGTKDRLQRTTTGLAFYREATNTPTFTDGFNHWGQIPQPQELAYWTGTSIDPPGYGELPQGGSTFSDSEVQPGAELSCAPLSTNWLSNTERLTLTGKENRSIDGLQISTPQEDQGYIERALDWLKKSPEDYAQVLKYLKGVFAVKYKNITPPTEPGHRVDPYELHIEGATGDVVGTFGHFSLLYTYADGTEIGVQELAVGLRALAQGSQARFEKPLKKCWVDYTRQEQEALGVENLAAAFNFAQKAGLHQSIQARLEKQLTGARNSLSSNP